jgi:polyisoprenoid-binding protein YceI
MKPRILLLLLATAAGLRATPLVVDPGQSRVEIDVKATVGSFVARLPDYEASVSVAADTGRISTGTFRFKFGSIHTGNAERDRDMNDWQQTVVYPEVVFVLAGVETGADGATVAQGELTFHGTRRPVRFPVSVRADRGTLVIAGEVAVDTRDYGLPVIRKLLILKVDPVVRLRFSLQGRLVAP